MWACQLLSSVQEDTSTQFTDHKEAKLASCPMLCLNPRCFVGLGQPSTPSRSAQWRILFFLGGRASNFSVSLMSPRTSMPRIKHGLARSGPMSATCADQMPLGLGPLKALELRQVRMDGWFDNVVCEH